MAGTVFVTKKILWSVGGMTFFWVTDLTRLAFTPDEARYVQAIYRPDLEPFRHILLDDVDSNCFRAFLRATKKQYEACKQAGKCHAKQAELPQEHYPGVMECWRKLIQMLEADPRVQEEMPHEHVSD